MSASFTTIAMILGSAFLAGRVDAQGEILAETPSLEEPTPTSASPIISTASPTPPATTPSTTTTITTTTTVVTTTVVTTPTQSFTTPIPTVTTSTALPPPPITSTSRPTTNPPPPVTVPSTSASITPIPRPTNNDTSSSSSSKVPIIVGSVAGVAVVALVAAVLVICYRRRNKRLSRDIPFDALEGMPGSRMSNRKSYNDSRQPIGLGSINGGAGGAAGGAGYDDYDDYGHTEYNNIGNAATAHHYNHQAPYGQEFGDDYGQSYDYDGGYNLAAGQAGYQQKPSIFQEDHLAYSASPMSATIGGRGGAAGYDQGMLPEIMYNDGNTAAYGAGGYGDAGYQQQGWDHYHHQGAAGEHGAAGDYYQQDPSQTQYQYEHDQQAHYPEVSAAAAGVGAAGSGALAAGSESPDKRHSRDPQAMPESPRVQQLRRGDLFGQESSEYARPSSQQGHYNAENNASSTVVGAGGAGSMDQSSPTILSRSTAGGPGSPRAMGREMRSFEMNRHSPGRSSNDLASHNSPQSYASDYAKDEGTRPSTEGLEHQKSLRTRRKDW
ncbi:hypothetical protein BGW41_000760 [Actinomortierella wolfii]|nr:hypothetical protein BGW41_000760 [Actinomortierella wolfii]